MFVLGVEFHSYIEAVYSWQCMFFSGEPQKACLTLALQKYFRTENLGVIATMYAFKNI